MMPAIITGGAAESLDGGYYRVPKRDLITGLQVLLQRGGLQIAAGLEHGPDAGEGAGGDAGEGDGGGAGAIRGVAGRDARRPGVRGGAGVLGGAEDVPEGRDGGGGYWRYPGWREREMEFRQGMEERAGWRGWSG